MAATIKNRHIAKATQPKQQQISIKAGLHDTTATQLLRLLSTRVNSSGLESGFYLRDAMIARVIVIATCPSVCLSVCPSRAGIVSKRRKLAA